MPVHLSSLILDCRHSLLLSLVWPLPICLDSWTWHSRFLCNIALYSIGPCFCHQSHPQLGIVFALAPSLHSFWSMSSRKYKSGAWRKCSSSICLGVINWRTYVRELKKAKERLIVNFWVYNTQAIGGLVQKLFQDSYG